MNRAQRRAYKKSLPSYRRETSEEKFKRMLQQGISPKDYDDHAEECWRKGWQEGVRAGREDAIKMCYAALCNACRKPWPRWGKVRILRLLQQVDWEVCNGLPTEAAIEEVFEKTGLELNFTMDDPLEDRVREA